MLGIILGQVSALEMRSGKTGVMPQEIVGPAGYLEWRAPHALHRHVVCSWTGGVQQKRPLWSEPVLPDGCMDVIWDGRRLFVAGPDTAPNWSSAGGPFAVGLRFRPGIGPLFLGVPAYQLRDQRVDLELLRSEAGQLAEALAGCSSLREAAGALEGWAAQCLPLIDEPDPVVEAAVQWSRGGASPGTAELAERAGVSERQLHRRFVISVGYGPKLLQRVLRFQAFLASCQDPVLGLAELAARAGYADQAHLTREARALAALTPAQLRTARLHV